MAYISVGLLESIGQNNQHDPGYDSDDQYYWLKVFVNVNSISIKSTNTIRLFDKILRNLLNILT